MAAITRFPDDRIIKGLVSQKSKEDKESFKKWKQEQFEVAAQDITFVLNSLEFLNGQQSLPIYNKLDLNHIGICGHSSGGSLAMRMCVEDQRIKAGISLDGGIRGNEALTPFATPFLCIIGEHSGQESVLIQEKLNQVCHKPTMQMTIMTLKGVEHGTFSDLPLLLHESIASRFLSSIIHTGIGGSSTYALKAIEKIKSYIVDFFDHNLQDKPTVLFAYPKCDKEYK